MLRVVVAAVAEADIAHLPHDFIKQNQQQQQAWPGAGLAGPAALLPATCSPELLLLLLLQPAAHIAAVLVAAGAVVVVAVAAAATAVALGQSRSQSVQTQSPIA